MLCGYFKVLEHIRPPLISPSYLPTVIESLDVVKEHEGCKRFISEATDRDPVPYLDTAGSRRPTGILSHTACTLQLMVSMQVPLDHLNVL